MELSQDERAQLQNLVQSDSWKTARKVIDSLRRDINNYMLGSTQGFVRLQGVYAGLTLATQSIEYHAKPQVQQDPEIGPLESRLRPRGL